MNDSRAVGDTWLTFGREAVSARQFDTAAGAFLHAARMGVVATGVERAKLLHAKGELHEALMVLEEELKDRPVVPASGNSSARSSGGKLDGAASSVNVSGGGSSSSVASARSNMGKPLGMCICCCKIILGP